MAADRSQLSQIHCTFLLASLEKYFNLVLFTQFNYNYYVRGQTLPSISLEPKGDNIMKEAISSVKGYIDDLVHLLMSFVAVGAMSEVLFGSGVFGVNVIGNLTAIISQFGQSGFAGLVALLLLVGLFRK